MKKLKEVILESILVKQKLSEDDTMLLKIEKIINEVVNAFTHDKKVLFCGNGGSAADAQHLAAEFTGRFYFDRKPLYAEALHVNTSFLTAVGNDYSYDEVYSRLITGIGREGDILFGISTSGNSKNIINALNVANSIGMITIGMTGSSGGKMADICKYLINIPSSDTPRIQEAHILVGHIICENVESILFKK